MKARDAGEHAKALKIAEETLWVTVELKLVSDPTGFQFGPSALESPFRGFPSQE